MHALRALVRDQRRRDRARRRRRLPARRSSGSITTRRASGSSTSGSSAIRRTRTAATIGTATPTSRRCACWSDGAAGPRAMLLEAWERYGLPIAVTEAHLGCTREQQLRWLAEVWDAARDARAAGRRHPRRDGVGGARHARLELARHAARGRLRARAVRRPCAASPRPTALARMARSLATTGDVDASGARRAGLVAVRRPRAVPGARRRLHAARSRRATTSPASGRPILIAGASGTLGTRVRAALRGARARLSCRCRAASSTSPIAARWSVRSREHDAWAVVNAAGYVRVDDAERDADACRRLNALAAETLARACATAGHPARRLLVRSRLRRREGCARTSSRTASRR